MAVGGDELVISSITIVEGDSGEVRTRQGSRAESPVDVRALLPKSPNTLHYITLFMTSSRSGSNAAHLEGVDEVSGTGSPSKGACELFDRFL